MYAINQRLGAAKAHRYTEDMEKPDWKNIPTTPGVYIISDAGSRVIYVGKARQLRRRVQSYFRPESALSAKTSAMLGQAADIETISTDTEHEALLLEATLIKKHRPRYNILLKDDKQYILFRLSKNSPFPSLTLTRKVVKDGSLYFGPFTSALAARQAWKAIQDAFPLRRCSDRLFKNRVRPCLYHYMNKCPAPCVLTVSAHEYAEMVRQVELLLLGRSKELIHSLESEMSNCAERMEFERAARLRDQIRAVKMIVERQSVVTDREEDWDIFGLAATEKGLALSILFVRKGLLLDKKNFFWNGLGSDDRLELINGFITQYYDQYRLIPDRIILPEVDAAVSADDLDPTEISVNLTTMRGSMVHVGGPRGRVEKGLARIAATNAAEEARQSGRDTDTPRLAPLLGLENEPTRIEAVDVAHIGGKTMRVGLVVFEGARACKEQFRLYAFPELEEQGLGNDDFAALAAWTQRRLKAGPPWPDLLLVDGGRGQLSAVGRVLDEYDNTVWPFKVIAMAKAREDRDQFSRSAAKRPDRRAGTLNDLVFTPGRKNPLPLKPGSPTLLFLQYIRDRAHAFVISSHRRAHRRSSLSGSLISLPGIGPKSAKILWDNFVSLEQMAAASEEELQRILPRLGKNRIRTIINAVSEHLARLKTIDMTSER